MEVGSTGANAERATARDRARGEAAEVSTAFASYLMAMAPLLIVYIFSQRWVISGATRGSIK